MTREELQNRFDIGDYLDKQHYKNLPVHKQDKLQQKVEVQNHDQAMSYINMAKRFTGDIRDQIIQKCIHWKTLVYMAQLTNEQVIQILQQIAHDPKSNRCAISGSQCYNIFYQVKHGTSTKPSNDTKKSSSPKQQPFEDLVIEEKTSEEEIQIRREFQDIHTSFRHSTNLFNSRVDSLQEEKHSMEAQIAKYQGSIKEIENISANFQALSEKLEILSQKIDSLETQKKTASNGHIKQTKR